MVYEYRVKGLFKVSAQIAGEICAELEQGPLGLSPKTLLDASRAEDAPLHDEFEWDDAEAAEQYREQQARAIIRNIHVVSTSTADTGSTRAFVNVTTKVKAGSYHNIQAVVADEDMYAQLMRAAKRDCVSFMEKYKKLEQLSTVISEMQKII